MVLNDKPQLRKVILREENPSIIFGDISLKNNKGDTDGVYKKAQSRLYFSVFSKILLSFMQF